MRAFASAGRTGRPKAARSEADHGTPEIQARRRNLARGGDPALSEYPLGLLLGRALVSADQHWAGCRYGMLYRLSVGRTQVTYNRLYESLAGGGALHAEVDAGGLAEARERFLAAKRQLLQAGPGPARAVEDLAVFHVWPDFLGAAANDNADAALRLYLRTLRRGLDALLTGFRRGTSIPARNEKPGRAENRG